MKTLPPILRILLVALTTGVLAVPASARDPVAPTTETPRMPPRSLRGIPRGAIPETVGQLLGRPNLVLPPTVWVYWNFPCDHEDATRFGYDTLVVKFEEGRVVDARIVSGARLRALLAAHSPLIALAPATP